MLMSAPEKQDADAAARQRRLLIDSILAMDCEFPVDFTVEYLERLSTKKLRHIHTALARHVRGSDR